MGAIRKSSSIDSAGSWKPQDVDPSQWHSDSKMQASFGLFRKLGYLIAKGAQLAFMLLKHLGFNWNWIWMLTRLLLFVVLSMPASLQIAAWYCSAGCIQSVTYGPNPRNSVDIYSPLKPIKKGRKVPVIVFITGGAWIIGYKAWAAMMAKVMRQFGVLFVSPDYRNFPQGLIDDQLQDVDCLLTWVVNHIDEYGGDPDNIFLVGQSAGSLLSSLSVLRRAMDSSTDEALCPHRPQARWRCDQIKALVSISGPYCMQSVADHFHSKGLDRSLIDKMFGDDLAAHSPLSLIDRTEFDGAAAARLPPMFVLHGTDDQTCLCDQARQFSARFTERFPQNRLASKFYPDKSHTDPILEDPIRGDDPLLFDLLDIVRGRPLQQNTRVDPSRCGEPLQPIWLLNLARRANPF